MSSIATACRSSSGGAPRCCRLLCCSVCLTAASSSCAAHAVPATVVAAARITLQPPPHCAISASSASSSSSSGVLAGAACTHMEHSGRGRAHCHHLGMEQQATWLVNSQQHLATEQRNTAAWQNAAHLHSWPPAPAHSCSPPAHLRLGRAWQLGQRLLRDARRWHRRRLVLQLVQVLLLQVLQ